VETAGGPHSARINGFPGRLSGTCALEKVNQMGLRWKIGWEYMLCMLIRNLTGQQGILVNKI